MSDITLSLLKTSLNKKDARMVTQDTVDIINNLNNDQDGIFTEAYQENFISFLSIMREGTYSLGKYMKAVKFCSHRLMGHSLIDSYHSTFPERYSKMLLSYPHLSEREVRSKFMGPYVTAYARRGLVPKIMPITQFFKFWQNYYISLDYSIRAALM